MMSEATKAAIITGVLGIISSVVTGLVTNEVSYKAGVEAGDSNARIAISTAMENQGYINQTVNVDGQGTGEIITKLIEDSKKLNEENSSLKQEIATVKNDYTILQQKYNTSQAKLLNPNYEPSQQSTDATSRLTLTKPSSTAWLYELPFSFNFSDSKERWPNPYVRNMGEVSKGNNSYRNAVFIHSSFDGAHPNGSETQNLEISYNLNGEYQSFDFDLFANDENYGTPSTITIYGDEDILDIVTGFAGTSPVISKKIPVQNVQTLRILIENPVPNHNVFIPYRDFYLAEAKLS